MPSAAGAPPHFLLQRLQRLAVGLRSRVRAHDRLHVGVVAARDRGDDVRAVARREFRRHEIADVARASAAARPRARAASRRRAASGAGGPSAARRARASGRARARRTAARERQRVHAFDPAPHRGRVRDGALRERSCAVLVQPRQPAERRELLLELVPRAQQVVHVLDRVVQRLGGQRPAAPVRACVALAELHLERAREQALEPHLRRPADQRGCDLRVDEPRRHALGPLPDHLEILTRAVQHPGAVGAEQLRVQGAQVERRQAVDARRVVARRDLDQAQLRVVRLLADELGVDGDQRARGDRVDERCERRVGRDPGMFVSFDQRSSLRPSRLELRLRYYPVRDPGNSPVLSLDLRVRRDRVFIDADRSTSRRRAFSSRSCSRCISRSRCSRSSSRTA